MKYRSIDRANVEDAAIHFEDACRSKNSDQIGIASKVLNERLTLIKNSNAQLYAEYSYLIKWNNDD